MAAYIAGNKLEEGSVTVIWKTVCTSFFQRKREQKQANKAQHVLIGWFSHERHIRPAFETKKVDKTWRLKVISLSSRTHSGGWVLGSLHQITGASSPRRSLPDACGRARLISLRNVPCIDLHGRLKIWPFLLHDKLSHQMVILSHYPL